MDTHPVTELLRRIATLTLALTFSLLLPGCEGDSWDTLGWFGEKDKDAKARDEEEEFVVPPDVKGTVAEVAALLGASDTPIGAPGVVIGLIDKGSSEVPPALKNSLVKYLSGQLKLLTKQIGYADVSVAQFLADKDTAIVNIEAIILTGAPKGTAIDVLVRAAPRTGTVSLEGGYLLPRDLSWLGGGGTSTAYKKTQAQAGGAIFINPFINPANIEDRAKLRQGRILGGGVTSRGMPVRLQLYKPSYHMSNLLQQIINTRFDPVNKKVAISRSASYLDLTIPPNYRRHYAYFLQLVMHLPIRAGQGAYTKKANEIAAALAKPGANYEALTLTWEAMGGGILPIIQKSYSSKNPAVRYFAARAGLRLNDTALAGPTVVDFAADGNSAFQLQAIEELGKHPDLIAAGPVLRKLLSGDNELVRITAYEALLARGDYQAVKRFDVDRGPYGDQSASFLLDVVDSGQNYVIYANQTLQPKFALFGEAMPLANPIFYESSTGDVTVVSRQAKPDHEDPACRVPHVAVFRKLPNGKPSKRFVIPFRAAELIRVLGDMPRPDPKTLEVPGLGLTYSQVVTVVNDMCKKGHIRAKFVLQPLPEIRKIYKTTPSGGRPDRPDR
jgi:hypothetical protein